MPLLTPLIDRVDADLVRSAVVYMVALILSITVHEFGHARVADYLGDRLPRSQGRVTLNPMSHIDLWGTVLFPLMMFVSTAMGVPLRLLGWGKPVQISMGKSGRYRHGLSARAAHFLVALAGPAMNLVFGLVVSVAFVISLKLHALSVAEVMSHFIMMNIGLALFNLLPMPPLDGGALLTTILGFDHPISVFLNRYGFILFFGLLMTGLLMVIMAPAGWVAQWWLFHLQILAL